MGSTQCSRTLVPMLVMLVLCQWGESTPKLHNHRMTECKACWPSSRQVDATGARRALEMFPAHRRVRVISCGVLSTAFIFLNFG